MPPNFSNRSAIRFMIFSSAAMSPEGRKRYQRASCSLSALSTSSIVGNPFNGATFFSILLYLKYANACDARTLLRLGYFGQLSFLAHFDELIQDRGEI